MSQSYDYPLGYSQEEARRLASQAALLAPYTEDLLRRAGLTRGMRVLDLGCGVGDVSMLAARLVGPDGRVLGIDRAASSLATARQRAAVAGIANVSFEEVDAGTFTGAQRFDALIGRLVLLYVPDPVSVLRRLSEQLVTGACVAFQEFDISQVSQSPPSELFMQVRSWILAAFVAGKAEVDMGSKLYPAFVRAGFTPPTLVSAAPVSGGAGPGFEYIVQVLRSLMPLVEKAGIASAAQVQLDSLTARLNADAGEHQRVTFFPRIVGAYARKA
jgi:2-polyprenyl-3-methyl-5-hydroxy-6-metoxy-1,4-benzoquinol methylase